MSRRTWLVAASVAAAVMHAQAQPPAPPPQPFRTGTDVVFVDVSVREGGRPVQGLTADDFILTDNGVRQRIESVEATTVPIDLTLLVDLSGSHQAALPAIPPRSKVTSDLQSEVDGVARMLRPDDRLRVIAIDRHVQQIRPLSPTTSGTSLERVEFGGLSALHDSLAAALLQPVEAARRHVVVARTKGLDTISSVDARSVRAIAEQSDALLHVVLMETALDNEAEVHAFQCRLIGLCWPTRRFWVPFERRLIGPGPVHALRADGEALVAAADSTGGRLHKTALLTEPTLTGAFRRAFEDFHGSYVLRYTPQGVAPTGWHALDVSVRGPKSYTVRARRGYGIDVAAVPEPVSVPEPPRTLADFIAAYGAGAYRQTVAALGRVEDPERLMRDFEAAGNPWPATPRREAVFALELAEPGAFSARAQAREQAHAMLERFTRFIRHPLEPDGFERYWHFGALALLEGTLQPESAEPFVTRALERFPGEPRFLLSRAILADQRSVRGAGVRGGPAGRSAADVVTQVREQYEAAIAAPSTEIEARIRLALFLHRTGDHDAALSHLLSAGAQPIADPALTYLRQLFLGHVLGALGRLEEAADAYRAAMKAWPGAQSARVALMNTLLLQGDRRGAEALAEQVQTSTSDEQDPWWIYWQGQYRVQPVVMARLREMMLQ